MSLEKISFGSFRELRPGIMEVVINEGVELTASMIEQIETGLLERYNGPYCCLVNRKHAYSHTADSMQRVATMKNLVALAIFSHSDISARVAQIHKSFQDNVQVFTTESEALDWLEQQLAQPR